MARKKRAKTKQRPPAGHARRREARQATRQRKQRQRTLLWGGAGVIIVGIILFLILRTVLNQPGERVADLGNRHIDPSEAATVAYNSVPPTSGPHYGQLASWGVHEEPVEDGFAIHNLEDGGVGVYYDCPQACPDLVAQLQGMVDELGEEGLLLAPYPNMESRIALVAWTRIDKFDQFDAERITRFVSAYRGIDHHR